MGDNSGKNFLDLINKIFEEESVCKSARSFILGETQKINCNHCYFSRFFYRVVKELGLDNEYFKRTVEALFICEIYDARDIYFYTLNENLEQVKLAISYLVDNLGFKLSKSLYLYLTANLSLRYDLDLIKYYYSINSTEVEDLIFLFESNGWSVESGGFRYYGIKGLKSYIDAMKKSKSLSFDSKIKKAISKLNYNSSFTSYLKYFDDDEYIETVLIEKVSGFLDDVNASLKTKDAILNFLKTGKKDNNFDKLVRKIGTEKKIWVRMEFSEFIKYEKPKPSKVYNQRLMEVSMIIDTYRTIEYLFFIIYSSEFNYKLRDLNEIINNWDAIGLEDMLNYLTYRIAKPYYGLEANKILEEILKKDENLVFDALSYSSGMGIEASLDFLYAYNKEKTSKFIIDNIARFSGKKLINKVVEIIQLESSSISLSNLSIEKLMKFIEHKKSSVRNIAILSLIKIDDESNYVLFKTLVNKLNGKERDLVIEYLLKKNLI